MMRDAFPVTTFGLHLHDAYGMGMANVVAGLRQGVQHFDSALSGIGGCPFAPGAGGNIATEDLVFMLSEMGIETGVDLESLRAAAADLRRALGTPSQSAISRALSWDSVIHA
jgi:hydroxymethylglutaryl-CoA lyase